jgi:ribonuclease D
MLKQKDAYQKADWSQRPLPADMLLYAAHDSHFLLAIAAM